MIILLIIVLIKMSDDSDESSPKLSARKRSLRKNTSMHTQQQRDGSDREIQLLEENNTLRKKLKRLSAKLDDQLEKAAKKKLKNSVSYIHAASPESQSLELRNAYKMIERLQKTVRDYEANESYQITHKRILDLENIIAKKQTEIQQLKGEIKVNKKTLREKEKHIEDLIDKQAVNKNINEQKQMIAKLKEKMKKLIAQNEKLKKVQMTKHRKLVSAERRIVEMEQQEEQPIGKQEELLQQIEEYKNKYKEAMLRIERQNAYITKLNSKLSNVEQNMGNMHRGRKVHSQNVTADSRQISKSVEELPDLKKGEKVKPTIFDHIPSPNIPGRLLRRY